MSKPVIGESLDELETPAVLVDLDVLDRNLRKTAQLAQRAGVKLRPHCKTHKSQWIAQQQIHYGASGITVAKLGEAEIMVEAGLRDILIAYPIVGRAKLQRLAKLMQQAEIIVSADNMPVAEGLSELGDSIGKRIKLYVDVNTGLQRCGLEPGEQTAELVQQMSRLPGIQVIGLMTHGGYAYGKKTPDELLEAARTEAQGLIETKRLLASRGIDVPEISVGSTPTSKFIEELSGIGITEIRPGAYVFGDGVQRSIGIITDDELAMHVLTTVVSTPRPGTLIIDAGSKTFSSDLNPHLSGYGILRDCPEVYVARLSEEHGIVHVPEDLQFEVGDRLLFVPNHCCTTTNLHNELYGIRHEHFERVIPVDARGQVR